MSLSSAIAWRYLRSKKRYGAVGTISTVSVCAMGIAVAAIICVLSVFNGFRGMIADRLDTLSPDVMVQPRSGKVFGATDSVLRIVRSVEGVAQATPTLSDNALIIVNGQEMPVTVKGVNSEEYAKVTKIKSLVDSETGRYQDDSNRPRRESTIAVGVAAQMRTLPGESLLIFAPRREGRVNMANPVSSFVTDSLLIAGIYQTDQQDYDKDGVLAPLESVRDLLQYDDESSAIEVAVKPGYDDETIAKDIEAKLGDRFEARGRMRQQAMSFRMVQIEKWVSFLLLGFILMIAGFNVISSMSMLVLDKQKRMPVMRALGMTRSEIAGVFAWESIYVALIGGIAGILLGLLLCMIQQEFGLIKLGGEPGAMIIDAYPVKIDVKDIAVTMIPISLIGIATAGITYLFARSRISR